MCATRVADKSGVLHVPPGYRVLGESRLTVYSGERRMHIYDLRCVSMHVAELCLVPYVTKGKSIIIATPTDTRISGGVTGIAGDGSLTV